MEPTHFLYLAKPPRGTFVHDATAEEYQILNQHFAFMEEVRQRGKLVLTGPALDGTCGIAIFKVKTQEEAEALAEEDPAVRAGLFTWTVHPLSVGAVTP